jgi:hypothetical protein
MRIVILALAITLLSLPAHAQGMRGGKKHQATEQKTDPAKKKTDDKDYRSAISNIPDKPYDPWKGVR